MTIISRLTKLKDLFKANFKKLQISWPKKTQVYQVDHCVLPTKIKVDDPHRKPYECTVFLNRYSIEEVKMFALYDKD